MQQEKEKESAHLIAAAAALPPPVQSSASPVTVTPPVVLPVSHPVLSIDSESVSIKGKQDKNEESVRSRGAPGKENAFVRQCMLDRCTQADFDRYKARTKEKNWISVKRTYQHANGLVDTRGWDFRGSWNAAANTVR